MAELQIRFPNVVFEIKTLNLGLGITTYPANSKLSVCASTCVCVCEHSLGLVHVRPEVNIWFLPWGLSQLQSSLIQQAWLVSEPQGSSCLCFLGAGIISTSYAKLSFFLWKNKQNKQPRVLGIRTRVLTALQPLRCLSA